MRIGLYILVLHVCLAAAAWSQKMTPSSTEKVSVAYAKRVNQGFSMKIWLSNQMTMGLQAWDAGSGFEIPAAPNVGLEYPVNSGVEHLYGAGPWIGGLINGVRHVSEGYNGESAAKFFLPDQRHPLRELIWHTSILNHGEPNRRDYDDDGDGKIDEDDLDGVDNDHDWNRSTDDVGADGIPDSLETGCRGPYDAINNSDPAFDNYNPLLTDLCHVDGSGNTRRKSDRDMYTEKNGIPDHGEQHVDEDYAAISESDYYMSATDTFLQAGHSPMGLKIIQKSYAWSGPAGEGILPMEYTIVNIGRNVVTDMYLSFFVDADVGPMNISSYPLHNYSCYLDSLHTAFSHNPVDRGSTPIGLTLLKAPRPLDSLKYIFRWYNFFSTLPPGPPSDSIFYMWMAGLDNPTQLIAPCQQANNAADTRFFYSFGPLDQFRPGDTVRCSVSFVSGFGVDQVPGSLQENAERAIILQERGFHIPSLPPAPPLRITPQQESVTLDWSSLSGSADPVSEIDPYAVDLQELPDTHWRRVNNPDPAGRGGRPFEGFKVLRSSSPMFDSTSFVELARYDVADDLGYGGQTGLRYSFVDSSVSPGRTYWYAVRSYTAPTPHRLFESDTSSQTYFLLDGRESGLRDNATRVMVGYAASTARDRVLVVPNPYRADNNYPGGEGVPMFENAFKGDNGIIWFLHLPAKATIRIFSLTGGEIATIEHDDAKRAASGQFTGQEEWKILSGSGVPLVSGIYVYTVESDLGKQVGKFVILR